MSASILLLLIGAILMLISAFVEPQMISLYRLAWACFLFALVLSSEVRISAG